MELVDNPIISLVDMDGTLAGYTEELNRRLKLMASPEELQATQTGFAWDSEPKYIRERMQVIKANPGFWTELPPLEDGFEILNVLHDLGYSIHILTKGPRYAPIGWMEKLTWCQKHIKPPINYDITITMDKGLVYGNVLVDDYPEYILRWLRWRKRGIVVMPDRPWNKDFEHSQVYRYTGNIPGLLDVLDRAYQEAKVRQRILEPS